MNHISVMRLVFALVVAATVSYAAEQGTDLKSPSVSGSIENGKARLIIEGWLGGQPARETGVFATRLEHLIQISPDQATQKITGTIDILEGTPSEVTLTLTGEGDIREVTAESWLKDWSIRQETNGTRTLVLRLRKLEVSERKLSFSLTADCEFQQPPLAYTPLALVPPVPALLSGVVAVHPDPAFRAEAVNASGLIQVEPKLLPTALKNPKNGEEDVLAYRFQGTEYFLVLQLSPADPEVRQVVLRDFKLNGRLNGQDAAFRLTARAVVKNSKGGALRLLSGKAALSGLVAQPDYRLKLEGDSYVLVFERAGDFLIELEFNAAVELGAEGLKGWKTVKFGMAPASIQPLVLEGLNADTQFEFANAARPERSGSAFISFLPADGQVRLSWKESPAEAEGKLFYAAEMLSQVTVSPGLMRQLALLNFKVMQGDMTQVAFDVSGDGEITRVQGDHLLSWSVQPGASGSERQLLVRLNQAVKDHFDLQVQIQTPLASFPVAMGAVRLRPIGATRLAGYFRVVNEGAVRLEVSDSQGLLQVSPEQFPESDLTRAVLVPTGSQRFAFRFSGPEFSLRLNADQILPEVIVSQVLTYHLGENEATADGEFELDIREAPLRELTLRVPTGYALARLNIPGMADYFLAAAGPPGESELRIVYAQPVSGRQVVQLRLERNQTLVQTNWALPVIEVLKAKSMRGHLAVSSDQGLRLTAERTENLTEIGTAFFPRKLPGIQGAFRLTNPSWQADFRIERLPQTLQADVLHLFSIGEGIAYGSSLINYVVSGAPIGTLNVALSEEYFNIEFSGKDVRNWQKTTNGYSVQLHTPVSGAYTLLVSYERPFKSQGDTLTFTGARPLDAQTEQGHTLITSAYQFQVNRERVSAGLLPLETGEVPPEYRLFFDAPVLAAYRYTARPFDLTLALSPLQQGRSLSQVVDRASLTSRVSKEGQVLTDVRYFVKNSGHPHLRLTLPPGTELWSATVNGSATVPVTDRTNSLVPLPRSSDPNALLTVDLKLASRSPKAGRIRITAPAPDAPVLLSEWRVEPENGRRLEYRGGTLQPVGGTPDGSGFAQLVGLFKQTEERERAWTMCLGALGLTVVSASVWAWTARNARRRYDFRFVSGLSIGLVGFVLAGLAWLGFAALAQQHQVTIGRQLQFLAPIQQGATAATIEALNLPDQPTFWRIVGFAWPAALALAIWLYATVRGWVAAPAWIAGWLLLCWAALRLPGGVPFLVLVVLVFILAHVVIPGLRRLWRVPQVATNPGAAAPGGAAPAVTGLIAGCLLMLHSSQLLAGDGPVKKSTLPPVAESISQEVTVNDKHAAATLVLRWRAMKGQLLPVLFEPAVLTSANYPTGALRLVHAPVNGRRAQQLIAEADGTFDVRLKYQMQTCKRDQDTGFPLPVQSALANELKLTILGLDVDVFADAAVHTRRELVGSNTLATLKLAPTADTFIGWRPRLRDTKQEAALFYAELSQLFVPAAGVVEGSHQVSIRPAQGQITELALDVPEGVTITDVIDDGTSPNSEGQGAPARVGTWRFDPDQRRLRIMFTTPQAKPFSFLVRSQVGTGPLPFERTLRLLTVLNAAGEVGFVGIGAGADTQLDAVDVEGFSSINLEDFPPAPAEALKARIPGVAVRRAFRYAASSGSAVVKASAVEPDVRVENQSTLSLGEDRSTLAATATVTITRAGIFRLSFPLPDGFDVDTVSGEALSHWTESPSGTNRVVTLHFKGKTEGRHQFDIALAGPGIKTAGDYTAPRLDFREAAKSSGTFLLVPSQGMRLQVRNREGLTQLDPQKSGVQQKGVLAFRVLQSEWSLGLAIEQVNSWVQVSSLQHATVSEALVKVAANLQYQIENMGLKSLLVHLPVDAENVRFQGEHITDFVSIPNAVTNGLQSWQVKLQRRVLGPYLLKLTYSTRMPQDAATVTLRGVEAADANLQRGYITVEAGGRLEIRSSQIPVALQLADWQSIPRAMRENLGSASIAFALRVVEPTFELPLQLVRHDAAKLLPARVNNVTLTSVISDNGAMLTHAQLEIIPGDKRLLSLSLPANANFWFAFVNRNGVWPWREESRILIPLEQQSRGSQPIPVEIFYTSPAGAPGVNALDLQLLAPKFDLPLENVTWRISLADKWEVKRWSGSFQFEGKTEPAQAAAGDVRVYLENEQAAQAQRSKEAEEMLAFANNALQVGDPQQAKRAFQQAYGLSTHDAAFNEDARVQLHNVKLQQALVGLNVRQAATAGDSLSGKLEQLRRGKEVAYTQQQAKDIIEANRAEDNAAFTRLAERLVQQQDAAVSSPAAIRAAVPTQGRVLTFTRAMVVDPEANLQIGLRAVATQQASSTNRFLVLGGLAVCLSGLWVMQRSIRTPSVVATS